MKNISQFVRYTRTEIIWRISRMREFVRYILAPDECPDCKEGDPRLRCDRCEGYWRVSIGDCGGPEEWDRLNRMDAWHRRLRHIRRWLKRN